MKRMNCNSFSLILWSMYFILIFISCNPSYRTLHLKLNNELYPKSVIPIKDTPQSKFYSAFTGKYYNETDTFLIGFTYTPNGKNLIVIGIHDSFYLNSPIISNKVNKLTESNNNSEYTLKYNNNYYQLKVRSDSTIQVGKTKRSNSNEVNLCYFSNVKYFDYKFLNYNNEYVNLNSVLSKDKQNILIFWSINCESCIRLLNTISNSNILNEKKFIFVHENEEIKNSIKFYEKYKSYFTFLLSSEENIRFFDKNGSPYEVMIDQEGNIRYDNVFIFK